MTVKAQAWVGGKHRSCTVYGTGVLFWRLSPTPGTAQCQSPGASCVPLVPMGVGQLSGTGGRTRV